MNVLIYNFSNKFAILKFYTLILLLRQVFLFYPSGGTPDGNEEI